MSVVWMACLWAATTAVLWDAHLVESTVSMRVASMALKRVDKSAGYLDDWRVALTVCLKVVWMDGLRAAKWVSMKVEMKAEKWVVDSVAGSAVWRVFRSAVLSGRCWAVMLGDSPAEWLALNWVATTVAVRDSSWVA